MTTDTTKLVSTPPLPLARYRFTARLQAELNLPEYAGSLLRGVWGAALRRTACMTGQRECGGCALQRSCPYPALFEALPPADTALQPQFRQAPNPYVIEPPPLGLRRVAAGEALVFHMVLIGADALRQLPLVVHAWQRALRHGLGPQRVAGDLELVERVGGLHGDEVVWEPEAARLLPHEALWRPPAPDADEAGVVALQIHTPLRLQLNGHPLGVQELNPRVLLNHLLRRVSLMLQWHIGLAEPPFDLPALLADAAALHDDRHALRWKDWVRYSSRQRQEMTLGGVVGTWHLHGRLQALRPWLALGEQLHLGKNATMGMGGYTLHPAV